MLAGVPEGPVEVPPAVASLAAGRPVTPVWRNEVGGLTFALGSGAGRRFVKWVDPAHRADLEAEAVRLRWARPFTAAPEVLGHGSDARGAWLVAGALEGENAVSDRWRARPEVAVRAVGQGLRALHDALPVASCPFSWSAELRVAGARRLVDAGRQDPARWHEIHRGLTTTGALGRLARTPPVDRLVVCHGDACAPNTLIGPDGRWSGHVDLGALGVADRWADLAVATWSAEWNYGPGWEPTLLGAYGVDPDPERTAHYRLLWDLGP